MSLWSSPRSSRARGASCGPLLCTRGDAQARPERRRRPGRRARDVARVRPAAGSPGGRRRGRRGRVRGRHARRRFLADVRPRGSRPVARARRATARGLRGDQGLGELRAGGSQPFRAPARMVRRPGGPAPDPQPAALAGAPRLDGGGTRCGHGPCHRRHDVRPSDLPRARKGDADRPDPGHPGAAQPTRAGRRDADPADRLRSARVVSCAARSRPSCPRPASPAGPRRSSAGASPTTA